MNEPILSHLSLLLQETSSKRETTIPRPKKGPILICCQWSCFSWCWKGVHNLLERQGSPNAIWQVQLQSESVKEKEEWGDAHPKQEIPLLFFSTTQEDPSLVDKESQLCTSPIQQQRVVFGLASFDLDRSIQRIWTSCFCGPSKAELVLLASWRWFESPWKWDKESKAMNQNERQTLAIVLTASSCSLFGIWSNTFTRGSKKVAMIVSIGSLFQSAFKANLNSSITALRKALFELLTQSSSSNSSSIALLFFSSINNSTKIDDCVTNFWPCKRSSVCALSPKTFNSFSSKSHWSSVHAGTRLWKCEFKIGRRKEKGGRRKEEHTTWSLFTTRKNIWIAVLSLNAFRSISTELDHLVATSGCNSTGFPKRFVQFWSHASRIGWEWRRALMNLLKGIKKSSRMFGFWCAFGVLIDAFGLFVSTSISSLWLSLISSSDSVWLFHFSSCPFFFVGVGFLGFERIFLMMLLSWWQTHVWSLYQFLSTLNNLPTTAAAPMSPPSMTAPAGLTSGAEKCEKGREKEEKRKRKGREKEEKHNPKKVEEFCESLSQLLHLCEGQRFDESQQARCGSSNFDRRIGLWQQHSSLELWTSKDLHKRQGRGRILSRLWSERVKSNERNKETKETK